MRPTDDELFAMIATERRGLADLLAGLPRVAPRDERAAAAMVTTLRGDAKTARGRAQGLRSAVPMTPPPASRRGQIIHQNLRASFTPMTRGRMTVS